MRDGGIVAKGGLDGYEPRKGVSIGLKGGRRFTWVEKGKWVGQLRPSRVMRQKLSQRVKWYWRPKKSGLTQPNNQKIKIEKFELKIGEPVLKGVNRLGEKIRKREKMKI